MQGQQSIDHVEAGPGRRFLAIFALVVVTLATLVAVVNRIAYRQMLLPENQTIVQLIDGWARVYKPILFDQTEAEAAVYGASWARDAFDPETVGPLTGLHWFNHAVSGSTPYEMRRFIESSLDDRRLKAVVLNLDTVLRPTVDVRMKYGFDEALLDTDPEGQPTRWLRARREFAITLSGAAIGNNLEVLKALRARDAGKDVSGYLESYDRFDFKGHEAELARVRELLPKLASNEGAGVGTPAKDLPVPPYAEDFERILDSLCPRDIDIYAYFTPGMVLNAHLGRGLAATMYALESLRRRQPGCHARLHYFNFNYPNVVTLDGIAATKRYSDLYRSDGHPRPTVGLLMTARMFGLPFPAGTPPEIAADFGVDLLQVDDADARLRDEARQVELLFAAVQPTGVQ